MIHNQQYRISDEPNKKKKLRQEVVVVLSNGTNLCGRVFIGFNERVLDVLNDSRHFIPIELENNEIIIIAKSAIIAIDALEKTSEGSAKFDKNVYNSFFLKKETQQPVIDKKEKPLLEIQQSQSNIKSEYSDSDILTEILGLKSTEDFRDLQYKYLQIIELLNSDFIQLKRKQDKSFDETICGLFKFLNKSYQVISQNKHQIK